MSTTSVIQISTEQSFNASKSRQILQQTLRSTSSTNQQRRATTFSPYGYIITRFSPPFDVHLDSNAGPRWTKWLTRFERLIVGMNITDATQKRALLLHYAGPDVNDIFETLPDTGEDKDYKKAVECLNAYFVPKVNTIYEEYQFRQAKQRSNESLASYHTRLRQLAKQCGFTDVDKEIRTQIVFSCTSHKLRLRALREDLSLTALLEVGRVNEITDQQARDIQLSVLNEMSMPCPHLANHILSTRISTSRLNLPTNSEPPLNLSVETAAASTLMLFPALPTEKHVVPVAKKDILPKFVVPDPSIVLSNT